MRRGESVTGGETWRLRLLAPGLLAIVLALAPSPSDSTIETAHRSSVLCLLEADPSNSFTRVLPAAEFTHGSFRASAAAITVTYNGFTPTAQAAFQYAVDLWAAQLSASVPIRVNASFRPLSGSTLGSAGATFVFRDFAGARLLNTWYAKALANNLAGRDLDTSAVDIEASFNSNFIWYYGIDGLTPAGQYDFVSVVLHELAHGFGFFGTAQVSSGVGAWGWGAAGTVFPHIYDRLVENGSGQAILDTALFPNPSPSLAAQLQSNALYWNGPAAATSFGARPRLYAPDLWRSGSSYSHLDEASYPAGDPNSLMTYAIGAAEAIHDPGPIVRGVLSDEGWAIANSPCGQATVSSAGSPFVVGTPVNWTAVATGCGAPEYRFWLYSQTTGIWTDLRTWSPSGSSSWTPTQPGRYIVQVWARGSGSTVAFEAWSSSGWFQVDASTPCSAASLSSSVGFPIRAGTAVMWSAQASGCTAPEFKFWLYSASTGTWTTLRSWSSTNSITWTPAVADTHVVQVWVRKSGSTADFEAWASSGAFAVTAGTGTCTSVSLGPNVAFPVSAGTSVTWTAQAGACSAPLYQFWLYSAETGSWSELRSWSSSNTAVWIPSRGGTYLVQAWARNVDSTAVFDSWTSSGYLVVRAP